MKILLYIKILIIGLIFNITASDSCKKDSSSLESIEISDLIFDNKAEDREIIQQHLKFGWDIIAKRRHYVILKKGKTKSFSFYFPHYSTELYENEPECYLQKGYSHPLEEWRRHKHSNGVINQPCKTFIDLIHNDTIIALAFHTSEENRKKYLKKIPDDTLGVLYKKELEKILRYKIAFKYFIKKLHDAKTNLKELKSITNIRTFICFLETNNTRRPNPLLAEEYYKEIECRFIIKKMIKINREHEQIRLEEMKLKQKSQTDDDMVELTGVEPVAS